MRLIMVRHGEPDYQKDCLTDEGRRQARAAAERLSREGIGAVYSSPNGRARETASFTAQRLGLQVRVLDFMHEITWGGPEIPENGHPWTLSDRMIRDEDYAFAGAGWRQHPYFRQNAATGCFDEVTARFDAFLEEQGYRHEGGRFMCLANGERTLALFSHGGSGGCVLSHMLSLPFPYVLTVMPFDFTSILILDFPNRPGEYVYPRLALFNDTAHLAPGAAGPVFQREPDSPL